MDNAWHEIGSFFVLCSSIYFGQKLPIKIVDNSVWTFLTWIVGPQVQSPFEGIFCSNSCELYKFFHVYKSNLLLRIECILSRGIERLVSWTLDWKDLCRWNLVRTLVRKGLAWSWERIFAFKLDNLCCFDLTWLGQTHWTSQKREWWPCF